MQFLSLSFVVDLHQQLILRFGGSDGIRDKGLLESALAHPQLMYSIAMERDIYVLAASYCYHLIRNHPFIDGNKRIGALAMLTFLRLNGENCNIPKDDLYDLAIKITTTKMSEKEIATILKSYSSSIDA